MQFGLLRDDGTVTTSKKNIEAHVAAHLNAGQDEQRSYAYSAIVNWPAADLAAMGIYPIRAEYSAPGPYQYQAGETYTLEGSEIVRRTLIADMTTEQVIAAKPGLERRADEQAEQTRAQYVTTIWGQETVYLEKETEAKARAAWSVVAADMAGGGDTPPPPPLTPYLTAEAQATGQDLEALVALVMTNSAAWRTLSVQIEAKRMKIKAQIDAAVTADDLRAVEW
jgi:hypothetical protein